MIGRSSRSILSSIALLVALWAPPASALTELDGIVAVVDDDIVLASELAARLRSVEMQMQQAKVTPPPRDVLINQLLERLILESLQLQMGERAGVKIDDETLARAIEGIAKQNNMTVDQFTTELAQQGMSFREFREQIRRELVIARVQRNRVNSRIYISDQEIDAFLASPYGQQSLADEYRVGHILLAVADDATPEAVAQAEAKAQEIHQQLLEGADFRQMAIANSAGSNALEGGDLGWRKVGELPTLFVDSVVNLKVGETAPPIRSGSGFHIVQVLDRRGASTQMVNQVNVRHILVKPSEIRSEAETKKLIEHIHNRIEAGEDFGALARQYSEDPGSALAGGELGWAEPEKYAPEFASMIAATAEGRLSPPFRTEFGWHVLIVDGHREQDMSTEARRNLAIRILHNRRFEEELQEWLREIRDEAFVEIRMGKRDDRTDAG
jgi:peptidyl-prolyl cis-trans isomerase SurA